MNFGNLAEHRNSNPQGRGLGLSICKSIVQNMGGNITVESKLGFGTSFNLFFDTVSYFKDESSAEDQSPSGVLSASYSWSHSHAQIDD